MLKNITLLIAFVSIISIQNMHSQAPWVFGLKGGPAWAAVVPVESGDVEEWESGYGFGAFMSLNITQNIGLQLEGMFQQKGGIFSNSTQGTLHSYHLSYMEFPALARFRIPVIPERLYPHGFVGYYVAKNTDTRLDERDDQGRLIDSPDADVPSFDHGMVYGGGIDFELEKTVFALDFRFNESNVEYEDYGSGELLHNRSMAVNFGVGFVLGR